MYDHTLPRTKRERIRELVLAKSATKDIVEEVNTTKEYVYKERGKLRREGLLVTHQSLSISNGQNEITMVKGERDRPLGLDRINDYDIPPLDKKNLMLMYDAFEQQKTPAYVTTKYGIHPEISHKEFERYLTMNSRNPYALQVKLTSGISNAPPQIQSIIDKSTKALLTNDEITSTIEFKIWNQAYSCIRDILLNTDYNLPPGLERAKCRICKAPQPGLIYDRSTYLGSVAQTMLNNPCLRCQSIEKEIYSQGMPNNRSPNF